MLTFPNYAVVVMKQMWISTNVCAPFTTGRQRWIDGVAQVSITRGPQITFRIQRKAVAQNSNFIVSMSLQFNVFI